MGKPEEKRYLKDPDLDGKIIVKLIFRKWNCGDMYWIDLVQSRDRWWAYVNAVMNFWGL